MVGASWPATCTTNGRATSRSEAGNGAASAFSGHRIECVNPVDAKILAFIRRRLAEGATPVTPTNFTAFNAVAQDDAPGHPPPTATAARRSAYPLPRP